MESVFEFIFQKSEDIRGNKLAARNEKAINNFMRVVDLLPLMTYGLKLSLEA